MLAKVECDETDDRKRSETLMKGFAIKASMSEMVSLGEGVEMTLGVKVFLAGRCKEEVLVIKDEVGSVDGFGGEAQKQCFVFCTQIRYGRGKKI